MTSGLDWIKTHPVLFTVSIFTLICLVLSITSVTLYATQSSPKSTLALFSSNSYPTTLKTTSNFEKLLYRYPVVSIPNNIPSGYFTVKIGGALVPSVKFSVKDQNNKVITSQKVVVSQITNIYFSGNFNTTEINLFINVIGTGLQLETLTLNIDR